MPIYAYRCESCGHAKDVLQKVSDPVLSTCPACQAETFKKQLTAAGFQLKGSGWYATDFRGGNGNGTSKTDGQVAGASAEGAKTETTPSAAPAPAPAAGDSGSSAASTGGGCGGPCACH